MSRGKIFVLIILLFILGLIFQAIATEETESPIVSPSPSLTETSSEPETGGPSLPPLTTGVEETQEPTSEPEATATPSPTPSPKPTPTPTPTLADEDPKKATPEDTLEKSIVPDISVDSVPTKEPIDDVIDTDEFRFSHILRILSYIFYGAAGLTLIYGIVSYIHSFAKHKKAKDKKKR